MTLRVALKIDVCNHRALHEGVPKLLDVLAEAGAPASFFVAFGPDRSGLAVRRVLRRGFLKKMLRTRAHRMYGFKTLLRGTLLPALPVGESAADLLRAVERAGHEVGIHGFDHVGWQDGLARMDESGVRRSYADGIAGFEQALGHRPRFSGAPGWQVSAASLRIQDELGFDWASDCREGESFYPEVEGVPASTLQLPTSLPTSDELVGAGRVETGGLAAWYRDHLSPDGVNVIGIHAEAEGIHAEDWFRDWLAAPGKGDVDFVRLSTVAAEERSRAKTHPIATREIPGRAGPVACSGVRSRDLERT